MTKFNKNNEVHFGVFGDIHGRISLMYTIALLWQMETNIKLSGLLQVGDMGAFPDISLLDESTVSSSKKDSDELGFSYYCRESRESEFYLHKTISPRTYFIRGNHEDFRYLSTFKKPTPIDPWGKIIFVPDGEILNTTNTQETLIGAFGGIPPTVEVRFRGKKARDMYKKSAQKAEKDPRYFTEDSVKSTFRKSKIIDILMTHAGPKCSNLSNGSLLLAELAERVRPKVHIFGHHHKVVGPTVGPGKSLLVGLEHFKFKADNSTVIDGSWGILTIKDGVPSFSFPKIKEFNDLCLLSRYNYRELGKSLLSQSE